MKIEDITGILLCSECENQLRVDVYSKEFGFFKIYPCTHCVGRMKNNKKLKIDAQESCHVGSY